jgi:hypothetical protein
MKKIKLKMIENTPDTVKELEYGSGYIVSYDDHINGEERLAIAIWRGGETDFCFPAMTFRQKPELKNIIGWIRAKDWRPDNG